MAKRINVRIMHLENNKSVFVNAICYVGYGESIFIEYKYKGMTYRRDITTEDALQLGIQI